MSDEDSSSWPVYAVKYRAYGQEITLRVEWSFAPDIEGRELHDTMIILRGYLMEPRDVFTESRNGMGLKELMPTNCVIISPPHITSYSLTDRPIDSRLHLGARFSTQRDRAGRSGYSVHIPITEFGKYNSKSYVEWGAYPSPDRSKHRPVYENRTEWPDGVTATSCPFYFEEDKPRVLTNTTSPATLVHDASLPHQQVWGKNGQHEQTLARDNKNEPAQEVPEDENGL
ncbi:hypothetical protein LOZ12_005375 [Ophidiomyces ophidiicola]|uniref:Uncharacterized protein n=1 Tax=Ophidiomyces ophidiicola TaxID=1387563 RepID=A0ACB8UVC6_9EURO|nr:hypothetical protein LOZ64_000444 [Ophidiomyces ophidiicola]KAI1936165.1 hypothetical protein LOZ62_005754 [Ophidiomyces ophidiicola]KAI1965566.1 hypothetical protein LOZ59_001122 [Ophidiomyces ophidiicola]KAI1972209.1 hypothetical protein LOZ56_002599 [Ophidiomyces ophidiicola]KAI2039105.1 hypothetical protein LOZ47_002555 [Ophidiomyces ophidiicola]